MLVKHVIRTISKQNPATGRYNFPGIKNTNINNIAATTITNFSSLCNKIGEANDTGVSPARLLAQEALKPFARRTGTRTLSSQYVDILSLSSCQNGNGAAILAAMTTGTLMLMYISQENKQHTCESEKRTRSKDIDKPINNIVILMAMEQEAAPFIKQHNLKLIKHPPWNSNLPFVAYEGVVGGMNVKLVWAGHDKRYKVNNVATTASTLSCYIAFEAFKPDLIISAGTAGGFKSAGGEIADVYLSSKCVFHSRRIPDSDTGYSEYGFGHYRSPPLELLANEAQCKIGVISTSDSLDYTSKDLQIMRGEGACIKEMEAAAIAWVCQQCSVPFVGIKAITDIVDNDNDLESVDEFEQNLAKASNKLQEKLSILLKLMAGEKLSKWSL